MGKVEEDRQGAVTRPIPARGGAKASLGWGKGERQCGRSPGVGGRASTTKGVHILIPKTYVYVSPGGHISRQREIKATVELRLLVGWA